MPGAEETQIIRQPQEVLTYKHGACLDLATLYCGACLHYSLLPVLLVFHGAPEGHALAAVCLTHELRQLKYDRPNLYGALAKNDLRELFADGDAFLKAIEPDGVYLAVECTGFSKRESPSAPPGFAREDGKLSFKGVVQAGLNYLKGASKKLSFALDINIAWTEWKIPIQPLDVVAPLPVWRPDFAGRVDGLPEELRRPPVHPRRLRGVPGE